MKWIAGIDIGGTKCAVSLGRTDEQGIDLIDKRKFDTPAGPEATIARFIYELQLLQQAHQVKLDAIGISCGGPLDSRSGTILSPPNLPGWHRVAIVAAFEDAFGVPSALQNDANACALAEWQYGAGRGLDNVIFLTFGTGMGSGLILDGRLYVGTNDMAGEIGHLRLEDDGPIGYGKAGSFEGYCSGGGIAQLAAARLQQMAREDAGSMLQVAYAENGMVSAREVGEAAQAGDALALDIFRLVGRQLGRGLAVLIDVLNPQRIIIGSIYARQQNLLEQEVMEVLRTEALPLSLSVCEVVPASLGEQVGDYASLTVAVYLLKQRGAV